MSTQKQPRNEWWIAVSFPDDWPDEPMLAGTTQRFSYPTEDAAKLAMQGFRMRGASV